MSREIQAGIPQEGDRADDYRFLLAEFFRVNPRASLPISFHRHFRSAPESADLVFDPVTREVSIFHNGVMLVLHSPRQNDRERICRFTADSIAAIAQLERSQVNSALSTPLQSDDFGDEDGNSVDIVRSRADARRLLRESIMLSGWSSTPFGGCAYLFSLPKDKRVSLLQAARGGFEVLEFSYRYDNRNSVAPGIFGFSVRESFLPTISSLTVGSKILTTLASTDSKGNGFRGIIFGPGDTNLMLANSQSFLAANPDFLQVVKK